MTAEVAAPMETRCSIAVFRDDTVLLIRSTEAGAEVWKLPGGHLRADEGMFHCAMRELDEETGLAGEIFSCAFLLDTRDPMTGRHVAEVVMVARAGVRGEPVAREPGLEPMFVPLARLDELDLRPPVAKQLRALHGHDGADRPRDLIPEHHESGPWPLL